MATEGESQGMWKSVKGALGGLFGSTGLTEDRKMVVEVTFGLIGFLAKSDGLITSYEAEFTNHLLDDIQKNHNISAREFALNAYDAGRGKDYDVEAAVARFSAVHKPGSEEMETLFDSLLRLSASDGRVYPRERMALVRLAAAFGMSEKQLDQRMANAG